LIGVVVAGAVVIAGIGFAGSYAAVRSLALDKGFGWFANVFPIGVDAGIVVLLALDLLLTWLRIPFPLLRQTAWLLTAATIAFNGASAWPDPLGVGMHAIIPVLFVVSVEAARHAVGRVADITADKHMESVRITRWILAPFPTFRLWRRMKLWELRSYEEVIRREQDRLVYRARLRARYGVAWRRKAPIEAIMPLRLAKYGVPLAETAEAGLQAAGIEVSSPVKQLEAVPGSAETTAATTATTATTAVGETSAEAAPTTVQPNPVAQPTQPGQPGQPGQPAQVPQPAQAQAGPGPDSIPGLTPQQVAEQFTELTYEQQQAYARQMYEQRLYEQQMYEQSGQQQSYEEWQGTHHSPWFAAPYPQQQQQPPYDPSQESAQQPPVMVPAGPNRTRPLGTVGMNGIPNGAANGIPNGAVNGAANATANGTNGFNGAPNLNGRTRPEDFLTPGAPEPRRQPQRQPEPPPQPEPQPDIAPEAEPETYPTASLHLPETLPAGEAYFGAYRQYVTEHGSFPGARQLARHLENTFGGAAPEERELTGAIRELRYRFTSEADTEHIP